MDKSTIPSSFTPTFNQLTLGVKLGSGGFGEVYKATYLGDTYAVKKLRPDKESEASKMTFDKEIDIMAKLRSPNIVLIYNHIKAEPYSIVMEYMPKGSLYDLLKNSNEKLEWPLRFRIALDIGKGIYFLHNEKIIHRDLKSLNVLIDKEYCAKIADFGLAKLIENSGKVTADLPRSLPWTAPELLDDKPATFASDIYAYGIILWEIAARQVPFADLSKLAIMKKVGNGEREAMPISTPPAFQKTIKACWDQAPEKRPDALTVMMQLKEGQQVQAEQELNVNPLPDVQAPQDGEKSSKQEITETGPLYQSELIVTSTAKQKITESGPIYQSRLLTQPSDSALVSGPQYASTLSGLLPKTAPEGANPMTKASQPSPAPAPALPLVQYQDTPEDLVKAATAMLKAKDWSGEQKAYFEELIQTLSLPPVQTLQGHTRNVNAIVLLPNGQLASGSGSAIKEESEDNTIKIWDLSSGQCVRTLEGHTRPVQTLLVQPNGQLVSESRDNTCKVWDLSSGQCVQTLEKYMLPTDKHITLLLPNGKQASGSHDGTIKILNLEAKFWQPYCQYILKGHNDNITALLLLPNGQLASGSEDKTIKVWDLSNGACIKTLMVTGRHSVQKLHLLGNTHLLSSTSGEIQCWRLDNWQCEQRYVGLTGGYTGTDRNIRNVLPLLSMECIATSGHEIQRFNIMPAITLRQALIGGRQVLNATGNYGFFKRQALSKLKLAPKTLEGHTSHVYTLLLLPNGQLASGSDYPGHIKIWDLTIGKCVRTLGEQSDLEPVTTMLLLPNNQLASGSGDTWKSYRTNSIKIWDITNGVCVRTLREHTSSVIALLLLPNGQLASGSEDETIKVWDLMSGQCKRTLIGHGGRVSALLLLPNGQLASGSGIGAIKIWNLTSGQCERTLIKHTELVSTLLLLPNGQLVSGSHDTTIKVWNLMSGQCERTLEGHTDFVSTLLLLPNGQLVSGSYDRTIKIWNLTSGQCEKTLKGHSDYITTLVLLPNGQLASGSYDGTIKLWDHNLNLTFEALEQKAPECKMM